MVTPLSKRGPFPGSAFRQLVAVQAVATALALTWHHPYCDANWNYCPADSKVLINMARLRISPYYASHMIADKVSISE